MEEGRTPIEELERVARHFGLAAHVEEATIDRLRAVLAVTNGWESSRYESGSRQPFFDGFSPLVWVDFTRIRLAALKDSAVR